MTRTDTAPYQPGLEPRRYEWIPDDDQDAVRLRTEVPGSDGRLFVVWCPYRRCRVLIEAYWPWDIRGDAYRKPGVEFIPTVDGGLERITLSDMLNPYQYDDFQRGGMVAVKEHEEITRPLDTRDSERLRAGDRAAQGRFRYLAQAAPVAHRVAEWRAKVQDERERAWDAHWDPICDDYGENMAYARTPKETVLTDISQEA